MIMINQLVGGTNRSFKSSRIRGSADEAKVREEEQDSFLFHRQNSLLPLMPAVLSGFSRPANGAESSESERQSDPDTRMQPGLPVRLPLSPILMTDTTRER